MKTIDYELLKLIEQNKSLNEITNMLDITNKELYDKLQDLRNIGINTYKKYQYDGNINYGIIKNFNLNKIPKPETKIVTNKTQLNFKAIVISDLHIGSKKERLDLLEQVYNYCIKNNIHIILNCGDLIDGLYHINNATIDMAYDEITRMLEKHPFDKNISNFICLGNHDMYFLEKFGINVRNIIQGNRHDLVPISYGLGAIKVKKDLIFLSHKLSNKNPEIYEPNKIIFEGHSHYTNFHLTNKENDKLFKVPSLCDIQINNSSPSFYEINFEFNEDGLFNVGQIKLLTFKKEKFVITNEKEISFINIEENNNTNNQNDNFEQLINDFKIKSKKKKRNKYE